VLSHRKLTYKGLSKAANVDFVDYGPERGVRVSLHGKHVDEAKPRGRVRKNARTGRS